MEAISIQLGDNKFNLTKDDFNNFKAKAIAEGVDVNMAMTVDPSAEYATNAREYYTRAFLGDNQTISKTRQLLNVKDRVKLGGALFNAVAFKPGAVNPSFDNSVALQKEFEVKPIMWATSVNISELEVAFMSDQLRAGSNNFSDQFEFMRFFYGELEKHISEKMEIVTFQGTIATDGVDGWEVKMTADTNVIKPTVGNGGIASGVTSQNVVAKLTQARNAVPKAIRKRRDFVYIVAQNVYDALADTVSENKASGLYYIEGEQLRFQGREVYLADGASANTIICTYWENLLNVADLTDDNLGYNVIDFMKTTLQRFIGIRADFKFQPDYVNANEIYFHKFV